MATGHRGRGRPEGVPRVMATDRAARASRSFSPRLWPRGARPLLSPVVYQLDRGYERVGRDNGRPAARAIRDGSSAMTTLQLTARFSESDEGPFVLAGM